jgi:hypothetical protein
MRMSPVLHMFARIVVSDCIRVRLLVLRSSPDVDRLVSVNKKSRRDEKPAGISSRRLTLYFAPDIGRLALYLVIRGQQECIHSVDTDDYRYVGQIVQRKS